MLPWLIPLIWLIACALFTVGWALGAGVTHRKYQGPGEDFDPTPYENTLPDSPGHVPDLLPHETNR